ncbi:helix-turn-helix domain-containing protein [Sphingosinicella sp. YJ22]|uniref:Crp/Fnr family transcriptional regulator n=1 Tax=Sphingosinicella sp. YJ22 TaxID=1104780 RepID=UPI0014096279|nr:helix-turn-helix domain-containing protein [Sphingosinicella sp. YJ22]
MTTLPAGHPCEDCPVRPITICRSLEARTLADMRRMGNMQRLQPDQPVLHEGDPAKRVFMLTLGALKIYTLLGDGRRQVTGFMFPGDFLGITRDEEYAFTIEALRPSELWWFSREAFDRFVEANPSVERELYKMAAHELAAAQQQMVLLGRKTAAERVASFFLNLLQRGERVSGRTETRFNLPMSRLDMADYLGLTKETVSRMLAELRDRRLIRLETQSRVEVLDRAGLADMAEGHRAA